MLIAFSSGMDEAKVLSPCQEVSNGCATGPDDHEGEETEILAPWRLSLTLFSLCVGLMLSMMDNSIVSTSIYTIALQFDSLAEAMWVILAYTLSYLGMASSPSFPERCIDNGPQACL